MGTGRYGKAMRGQRAVGTVFTGARFTCGKIWHRAKNCPMAGRGFGGACYVCGEVGHMARECPKGKGQWKGVDEVGSGSEGASAKAMLRNRERTLQQFDLEGECGQ